MAFTGDVTMGNDADDVRAMTKTKTEQRFVTYLTRGNRGECRVELIDADTSDEAIAVAKDLWPGWRVYGVQLSLESPEGGIHTLAARYDTETKTE